MRSMKIIITGMEASVQNAEYPSPGGHISNGTDTSNHSQKSQTWTKFSWVEGKNKRKETICLITF